MSLERWKAQLREPQCLTAIGQSAEISITLLEVRFTRAIAISFYASQTLEEYLMHGTSFEHGLHGKGYEERTAQNIARTSVALEDRFPCP